MPEELRHVPLNNRHIELGAKMVPFGGFLMPVQYTGIKDEHHAVRSRSGIFDVSHMGEIEIQGADAIEVLNGLITNDATSLEDGQALYTVICNEKGGIVDDVIVYRLAEDHVLVCVNASNREKVIDHFQKYRRGQAELRDCSDSYGQFAVQGPNSQVILQRFVDCDLGNLKTFRSFFCEVAGHRALVARTGYTGEDGFELYVPAAHASTIFDALVEGTTREELALCGLGCRDTLRLEARLNLYGHEMDEQTNPFEAGLSWVVKLDKSTSFVGQDALKQIESEGVRRRLRGFVVEGRGIIRSECEIYLDGSKIGELTSGTYSPTLERSIGLGYIDVEHADASNVEIDVRGRRLAASVTNKPFYRRGR